MRMLNTHFIGQYNKWLDTYKTNTRKGLSLFVDNFSFLDDVFYKLIVAPQLVNQVLPTEAKCVWIWGAEEREWGAEEGEWGAEEREWGAEEGEWGAEEGEWGAEEGEWGAEEGEWGAEEGEWGAEEGE